LVVVVSSKKFVGTSCSCINDITFYLMLSEGCTIGRRQFEFWREFFKQATTHTYAEAADLVAGKSFASISDANLSLFVLCRNEPSQEIRSHYSVCRGCCASSE